MSRPSSKARKIGAERIRRTGEILEGKTAVPKSATPGFTPSAGHRFGWYAIGPELVRCAPEVKGGDGN